VQEADVFTEPKQGKEIDTFRATKHFGEEAIFENGKWQAQWHTAPFLKGDKKYILDQVLAERVAACRQYRGFAPEV